MKHIIGAVLAGGQGTRLGNPHKGLISHPTSSNIIDHVMTEMTHAGIENIVISANDPAPYQEFHCPIIPDIHPGMGPLAGIEAVLRYAGNRKQEQAVLFLPSDMPLVDRTFITKLSEAFEKGDAPVVYAVEKTDDLPHPICCIVQVAALSAVTRSLENGRYRVRPLWKKIGCKTVEFDTSSIFLNLNTHQDLSQWGVSDCLTQKAI